MSLSDSHYCRWLCDRSGGLLPWGLLCLLCLAIPAVGDTIRWKDGHVEEGIVFFRGTEFLLQTGRMESRPLDWNQVSSVRYEIIRHESDFAAEFDQVFQRLPEIDLEAQSVQFSVAVWEEMSSRLWQAVGSRQNTLDERDAQAFFSNHSIQETLQPMDDLGMFLKVSCESAQRERRASVAVESCMLKILMGYRLQESVLPERYQQGLSWVEEGLENLAPLFNWRDSDERDWNLIFWLNRLQAARRGGRFRFPEDYYQRLHARHLSLGGVDITGMTAPAFPADFIGIAQAYIRQCHEWMETESSDAVRQTLKDRQKQLAVDWVKAQKPGISKTELFGMDLIEQRQIRAGILSDLAYLTSESLIFKRKGRRLSPTIETNMPPLRDPYDGNPYRFVAGDPVDVFYSIGPDRVDHQAAKAWIPGKDDHQGDIFLLSPGASHHE